MSASFDRLVNIMARLRGENGCPWDREQTHESLKPYLVEETYEVIDAIDSGDMKNLKEELGDFLLQVVFHATLAKESGEFGMDDVCDGICEKLIRRHPHVFGQSEADTAEKVLRQWNEIKKVEKTERKSILDGVPKSLPALLRASLLQEKASSIGFDWSDWRGAFAKIEEETAELKADLESGRDDKLDEEFGDLLFSIVNVTRFLNVDPENALRMTIAKFIRRFEYVEKRLAETGVTPAEAGLERMDALWNEAKTNGV